MSSGLIILVIIERSAGCRLYGTAVLMKKEKYLLQWRRERNTLQSPCKRWFETVKNQPFDWTESVAFREWNQKWVDLSAQNSFADIEKYLFEAERLQQFFSFHKKPNMQLAILRVRLIWSKKISRWFETWKDLKEQESKNSGRGNKAANPGGGECNS